MTISEAFNVTLNAELGILSLFFLLSWILNLLSLLSKHKRCVAIHAPEGIPNLLAHALSSGDNENGIPDF